MANIYEKVLKIQLELKAPKSQFNSFGKYKYRNLEDVLEAVKPLLDKYKAMINITDEIVLIGDRYYVKATASIKDTEKEGQVEAVAYAREDENKKGMDLSQLSGSTSSYARKYALNGLLAIDDTKDADTTNTQGKEENYKPHKNNNISEIRDKELVSDAQVTYIDNLMKKKKYQQDAMNKYIKTSYNKTDLKALSKKEASELINMLNGM